MKAIVAMDRAAGTAEMTLMERPEPPAAINDIIVQIHASGFVPTELEWVRTLFTPHGGLDELFGGWGGRSGGAGYGYPSGACAERWP
jgi:NADPH:quinone reductase-like Zn-dependent oxidoreductase